MELKPIIIEAGDLLSPIKYGKASEPNLIDLSFIELRPPTSRCRSQCADLKQAFMQAIHSMSHEQRESASNQDDGKEMELNGDMVMSFIAMSQGSKLKQVIETAIELFCNGFCYLDGEVKINKIHIDSMNYDDIEKITGEYIANFIVASALRKMKRG